MTQNRLLDSSLPSDWRCLKVTEKDDVSALLPHARWLVVYFFPYRSLAHPLGTNLSVYAMDLDYHRWVRRALDEVCARIQSAYPAAGCKVQVDIGPINERQAAFQSGLALEGKNQLAIHPLYGSYGFLGLLATDAPLSLQVSTPKACMGCNACERVCPGQALRGGQFYKECCASYLTQAKHEISPEQWDIIKRSGYVFGCDLCQRVCPHNLQIKLLQAPYGSLVPHLTLEMFQGLTNRSFRENYQQYAFSWRGKALLLRNLTVL